MTSNGKAQTITCRGCGQVGAVAIDPKNEFDVRQRRQGFYMHERGGVQMIACCKCQQIQPVGENK